MSDFYLPYFFRIILPGGTAVGSMQTQSIFPRLQPGNTLQPSPGQGHRIRRRVQKIEIAFTACRPEGYPTVFSPVTIRSDSNNRLQIRIRHHCHFYVVQFMIRSVRHITGIIVGISALADLYFIPTGRESRNDTRRLFLFQPYTAGSDPMACSKSTALRRRGNLIGFIFLPLPEGYFNRFSC